jgi:hypothetical protein
LFIAMQATEEVARDIERQIVEATQKVSFVERMTWSSLDESRTASTVCSCCCDLPPLARCILLQIDEFVAAQTASLTIAQQNHDAHMRDMEERIARLKAEHAALGLRGASTANRESPVCAYSLNAESL